MTQNHDLIEMYWSYDIGIPMKMKLKVYIFGPPSGKVSSRTLGGLTWIKRKVNNRKYIPKYGYFWPLKVDIFCYTENMGKKIVFFVFEMVFCIYHWKDFFGKKHAICKLNVLYNTKKSKNWKR